MGSYILLAVLALWLIVSIRIINEQERIVVFRLGRFERIKGPGLVIIIPFVDKGVRVNLSEQIPGWEILSNEELEEKIKTLVIHKPL